MSPGLLRTRTTIAWRFRFFVALAPGPSFVILRQRFVRRCHCGWGGICALLRECAPNFYHRSMFIIPHGAPEGYEWFVALLVLVGLYFAVRNFMGDSARGNRCT